jgi:hypothetical protein
VLWWLVWRLAGGRVVLKLVQLHRYYTISIVLGTVALSYGSVPMYKMVCPPSSAATLPTYPTYLPPPPTRPHEKPPPHTD